MKYYNLKDKNEIVSFKEATIKGQGEQKGLFFPEEIPAFPNEVVQNLNAYSDVDLAFLTVKEFVGDEIPENVLYKIVSETIDFSIPLEKISDSIFSLELFHGPTLAFKDVGARFMSRCLSYFLKNEKRKVTVLVATSGDTGGAVANGFYNVPGVEVVILYPKNRVSPVQEKQLTALGGNIKALEVDGSFDDCQNLVKMAFADSLLNEKLVLTSANSINVARWLPQQIYYVLAKKQWQKNFNDDPIVCVPSGNFGNLCAGILASKRGVSVKKFIAACNENDVVPHYLQTGELIPKETVATLSNAMDVGNPSNFVRILELFNQDYSETKNNLEGFVVSDGETKETIKKVHEDFGYVLDPHGAVAFAALSHYVQKYPNDRGFILETAHPIKFPDAVELAIGKKIDLPSDIENLMLQEKKTVEINPNFKDLKQFLLAL